MPTYSEMEAMLYELTESDLADLYEMYKADGPPPQYSDYEMPTYSEMEAYLYGLSESDLAELYDMYKAYGPPPTKEGELAQEGEDGTAPPPKGEGEGEGPPPAYYEYYLDYDYLTYSEAKAALYALSESDLEELYAAYKAYGPPPMDMMYAQEGEEGTAPPPKDEGEEGTAPPPKYEGEEGTAPPPKYEGEGPPPAYYGYDLPYELTYSEMDAMYEMFKAYGMPSEEDLEAMYAFYKEYGMEGLDEAAKEE
jgi:hypothetical protein